MNDPQFDMGETKNPYESPGGAAPYGPEGGHYAEPRRKSRGCFFYGCIIALVLGVIGMILMGIVAYMGYSYYMMAIQTYTSTTPAQLPEVTFTEEQKKAVTDRWEEFKKAVEERRDHEIVLTADDLNALIARQEELKGRVYITLEGDEATAQISIPLGETGLPGTKGRYLNGKGTVTAHMDEDGELVVQLRDLDVNGQQLPPNIKSQIANENLAREFSNNPDNREMLRKIKSIEVKDGKVHIQSRARPRLDDVKDEPPSEPAPEKAEVKEAEPAAPTSK